MARPKKVKEPVVVNKNAPIYSTEAKINKDGVKKEYRIEIKKPKRSTLSEAEMFYSIQFSKYIKMGLLTAEQIAKRQIDIGGTFTEDQQKKYIELQSLLAEKEEMYLKLMAKKESLSEDEEERKSILYRDMAMIRSQLTDYEYIRNQAYEHTANVKARNDVIEWLALNLTVFGEVKDEEDAEMLPMFEGENYETKKMNLEQMEENEDELAVAVLPEIYRALTLWYWMGIGDREKIKKLMKMEENA